ncbi:MAG TPA: hypothetical protein VI997_06380 [Candidatus Thermoplasmatota archaeon]|nr:hypothetical protein [Candidatus Thermoplasmatota archaeon]
MRASGPAALALVAFLVAFVPVASATPDPSELGLPFDPPCVKNGSLDPACSDPLGCDPYNSSQNSRINAGATVQCMAGNTVDWLVDGGCLEIHPKAFTICWREW